MQGKYKHIKNVFPLAFSLTRISNCFGYSLGKLKACTLVAEERLLDLKTDRGQITAKNTTSASGLEFLECIILNMYAYTGTCAWPRILRIRTLKMQLSYCYKWAALLLLGIIEYLISYPTGSAEIGTILLFSRMHMHYLAPWILSVHPSFQMVGLDFCA